MPSCVVKWCHNYRRKITKDNTITFHLFPRDPILANRWIAVIQQTHEEVWCPHRTSVVCSDHFSSHDMYYTNKGLRRLKRGAVPNKRLFISVTDKKIPENVEQDTSDPNTGIAPSASLDQQPAPLQETVTLPQPSCSITICDPVPNTPDISDLDSIFDSPHKAKLRRTLRRKILLEKKHKAVISSFRKKNIRLKKKNVSFKEIICTLRKQRFINEDVQNALEGNLFTSELYTNMRKKIKGQGKRPNKYTPEFRKFCLTLHFLSPRAYSFVRRKFETCLPHPKTLSKWYSNINGSPGITEDAFQILKTKRQQSDKNLICALVADEMAIRQQKCWNNTTHQDDGLVDIGTGPDENINVIASEAYVFMLVSLNEPWKLPVAYFLIHGLTGVQKANIIKMILSKCNDVGVDVVSLTFDGHSTNLSALEILGCKIKCDPVDLKTTFKHPDCDYDVAVFLDPCHMIKLIRNHFESKECFLTADGKEIKWEYVKKLSDLQSETGLHLANKLTKKHINFRNSIMNVKLATQVLSRSVSRAIEFCRVELQLPEFEDSEATERFIMLINNIFDILNSRNLGQHGFSHPLLPCNKDEVFTLLEEAKEHISNLSLKISRKRTFTDQNQPRRIILKNFAPVLKSQAFTGFLGILVCIESLKKVYESLINTDKLKYLTTYRLSQDHIELFFGAVRMHGGYNDNPNAKQFKGIYRKLLCHMELKAADSGNCVPLESVSILTCTSAVNCINATTPNIRTDDENDSDIFNADSQDFDLTQSDISVLINPEYTEYFEQVIGYIAGFAVRRICKIIKCASCKELLHSEKKEKFHKLVGVRDKGGLIYASEDAFKICKTAEYLINYHLKQGNAVTSSSAHKKISLHIMSQFIGSKYFLNSSVCSKMHQTSLLKLLIEKYLQIRCHHICKSHNISHEIKSKRKVFRKQIQRDGF